MDFFSLGMFCIDEIHTPRNSYVDVIGGAGTYAALGAGTLLSQKDRQLVGFICDEGHDFPSNIKSTMLSWGLGTVFRHDESRETTKAWNKFVDNEERLFKYLSPKRQIFPDDLPPVAVAAKAIHLICSPPRCAEIMREFQNVGVLGQKYVWEPVPTECHPDQFENLKSTLVTYNIDVLSPNALEAAALVGLPEPTTQTGVEELVKAHFKFAPNIVVRCGALGCYLRTATESKWYPPYFTDASHIKDPSGAGNAFTGGLGLAMARNLDWDTSIAFASVAASYMVEQVGTPHYDAEHDVWNNDPTPRVQVYLDRLHELKQNLK